ncbi:MAG TPA: hypothetical protein PK926_02025 [Spirochaetota bacterium]|nr:hypothetical protein [Spirochaetota bacterium]HPI90425.1 hypothetical protein [Spirochaetota bacterium]HPR46551.1 hypothetical protein [Spirochaetota bacterium]
MNIAIYIIGLLIGIAVFVYLLSTYESGKEKITRFRASRAPRPDPGVTAEKISVKTKPGPAPGERMCPVCRSMLSKYEALYASEVETRWGRKIMIYGCRYCYKPEEDPDQEKKSAY